MPNPRPGLGGGLGGVRAARVAEAGAGRPAQHLADRGRARAGSRARLGSRQLRPVRGPGLDPARRRRTPAAGLRGGNRQGDRRHGRDDDHRPGRGVHPAAAAVRRDRHQAHRVSIDARRRAQACLGVPAAPPRPACAARAARPGDGVRLGLVLAEGPEAAMARAAEAHGLFGVLAGMGDPRTAITAAVYASTATDFVRIAVRVRLGLEHPVTIAEELAVIREALGNRPLEHEGTRWKAPAGLPANATAPRAIAVTPKPAQLEVPVWITGKAGVEVARDVGLPALAQRPQGVTAHGTVQPALAPLRGSLDHDREMVGAWAAAGATHLLLELPAGADEAALMVMVSRHLAPEVAMPHFPRVMSNSRVPLPWPGDGRG